MLISNNRKGAYEVLKPLAALAVLASTFIILIALAPSASASDCKYYVFLETGLDVKKNKVYRSSGVRKYLEGVTAAYSPFGDIEKNGFTLQNLGPFAKATQAKDNLEQRVLALKAKGYAAHGSVKLPRIMLLNKKLCH